MHLTPREQEKLMTFTAAEVARRRRALGLKLNYPEAVAIITPDILEGARDGKSVAGAMVHAFASGRVVLVPLTTSNVPEGRALEVWTLPSRERGPDSVGLMSQARTLQLNLKDLTAPGVGQLFEITMEPATGSPTGRPTGQVLCKGNTALALR